MELPAPRATPPEVFSLDEIARAAGVPLPRVHALVDQGAVRTFGPARRPYVARAEAIAAVRALTARRGPLAGPRLFGPPSRVDRAAGLSLAGSGAVHVGVAAVALALAGANPTLPATFAEAPARQPHVRLVFVSAPGAGGGGGGGGQRRPRPPSSAARQGLSEHASPVPARRPPAPVVAPPRPDPLAAQPLHLVAPVVSRAADERDRPGTVDAPVAEAAPSAGPGGRDGAGMGRGAGIGSGRGDGLGDGTAGGLGGGSYGPGSGVTPPQLLREVKPDYTESARLQAVEGEVVLEVVVRRDGTVGDVRLREGLGHGLDERAMAAVQQWRFVPAARLDVPIDVLVEIAVEFRLR